jgi:hypothetical protein
MNDKMVLIRVKPANAHVECVAQLRTTSDAVYFKLKMALRRVLAVAVLESMDDSTLDTFWSCRSWELSK